MLWNGGKNNPCFKCEERKLHCHSECEAYRAFNEMCEQYRAKAKEVQMINETMYFGAERRYKHARQSAPCSKERKHEKIPGGRKCVR